MSEILYLTDEERERISDNMATFEKFLMELFKKAYDEGDHDNKWSYLMNEFNSTSLADFELILDKVKYFESEQFSPTTPELGVLNTVLLAFSETEDQNIDVDHEFNVRAAYIMCTIANMNNMMKSKSLMDNYLRYNANYNTNVHTVAIIEERANLQNKNGYHTTILEHNIATDTYIVKNRCMAGERHTSAALAIVNIAEWIPDQEFEIDGVSASLMSSALPKDYVLLAKNGRFGLCNQDDLAAAYKVEQNPLGIIYDGWHYALPEDGKTRFISGIYSQYGIESLCNILGTHSLRTSLPVGSIGFLDLGVHSANIPVEVWLPLIETHRAIPA